MRERREGRGRDKAERKIISQSVSERARRSQKIFFDEGYLEFLRTIMSVSFCNGNAVSHNKLGSFKPDKKKNADCN